MYTDVPAAVRAVDMALKKWRGEPYTSEFTVETFEAIPPASPSACDPARALVALVTEAGLVRQGEPGIVYLPPPPPTGPHTVWLGWTVSWLASGMLCTVAMTTPRRCRTQTRNAPMLCVSLNVKALSGSCSTTCLSRWATGSLNAMKRIGAEIAATLVQRGVQGVVLPAT